MTTQAPQVLSRKANGTLPAPGGQTHESGRRKNSGENATHQKLGRGRGSSEKHGDNSKNQTEKETPKPARSKAHNEGEKLVIRRLPPGMTEAEFVSILGPDWELSKGKVDWLSYAPGKVSHDPSKPSRPARAYVHVTRKDHILALNDAVRTSKWEDAQATFNNPSLIGPPCVEIAIYKKVPNNKKRTDARQGTIDQDPEFMAFLEDLANPAPPKEAGDDDGDDTTKTETKTTTTPLIEYLKEKKANKAKEAAAAKSAKHGRQESGTGKGKGSAKDDESAKKKGKESKGSKADKAPKETVKILTKKAAVEQAAEAAKAATSQASRSNGPEGAPKSRRAGIAAAAKILQRDLGLSPGSAHRKARQDAAKAESDGKPSTNKEAAPTSSERPASPAHSIDAAPQSSKSRSGSLKEPKSQPGRRTRGGKATEKNKAAAVTTDGSATASTPNPPVVLLKKKGGDVETAAPATPITVPPPAKDSTSSKPAATPSGPKNKSGPTQKKAPAVTPEATRGFVKHANPSQGVTEALLKQALEVYGTITFVEIDKRKGFAYVDFAEHEGLVKAVSASPVSVAQGTVQVLERKDKKPANVAPSSGAAGSGASEKMSGRGRRGRGGGGKANTTSAAGNQSTATAAATSGG